MTEPLKFVIVGAITFCVALMSASYVGGERAKAEAARETKEAALALRNCKFPPAEAAP